MEGRVETSVHDSDRPHDVSRIVPSGNSLTRIFLRASDNFWCSIPPQCSRRARHYRRGDPRRRGDHTPVAINHRRRVSSFRISPSSFPKYSTANVEPKSPYFARYNSSTRSRRPASIRRMVPMAVLQAGNSFRLVPLPDSQHLAVTHAQQFGRLHQTDGRLQNLRQQFRSRPLFAAQTQLVHRSLGNDTNVTFLYLTRA